MASSPPLSTTNEQPPKKKVGYGPNLVFADRSQPTGAPSSSTQSSSLSSSSSSSSSFAAVETKKLNINNISPSTATTSSIGADLAASLVTESQSSIPLDTPQVRGPDFNNGVTLDSLFAGWRYMGLQATNLVHAVDEVNRMIRWRLSDEPVKMEQDGTPEQEFDVNLKPITDRSAIKCTIFLGYTSNMISSGVREVIRFLAQHSMIQCIVTTAGGVEEDLIKCLRPFYCDDYKSIKGAELRKRGVNRIGPNIGVPNINYCAFQDWIEPILDKMLSEQKESKGKLVWTPSTMIARLGKEINNEESVYYWAYKNQIPVFCPALTDGSLGDMIYFHGINNPGLILDIAGDITKIMEIATSAKKSGQIILGGGIVKHHICNANLMRNGADFSVYINTGTEYDGSDAGAPPDEAVSWGKIKIEAKPVKVWGDASLIFPLVVAQTFARLPLGVPSVMSVTSLHRVGSQSLIRSLSPGILTSPVDDTASAATTAGVVSETTPPPVDRQVSAVLTALTATVDAMTSPSP